MRTNTLRYDGQGRRIIQQLTNSGNLDSTYHYYMRDQFVVETRNGSDDSLSQYLWASDVGYIDELCQVTLNADPRDGGGSA